MQMPKVSDAELQYLRRVVEDCAQLLGPEVELRELQQMHANGHVTLRLRYGLGEAAWTSEGRGETVIAAHADLRERLVLDRIRIGVRALVHQGR